MSLLALNISARLGARALVGPLSLEIVPGKIHALLGPNGAGKTSLLRLFSGELRPAEGEVGLDGVPLRNIAPEMLARRRAVFSQQDSLNFGLLVGEVVALGRMAHPDSRALTLRVAKRALEAVEMEPFTARSYLSLSGGERVRVRIARALTQVWEQFESGAESPARYLLLDEPAAHLDPGNQHSCLRRIRSFADRGGAVLVSLHDPNLALAYADTVSLIRAGRLVATGPADSSLQVPLLEATYGVAAERVDRLGRPPFIIFGAANRAQS